MTVLNVGAVFSENLHAPAIVAIQVRAISFFAECGMRGCGARAAISIRPVDYIGRPARADLLVCAAHAAVLKERAARKGIAVSHALKVSIFVARSRVAYRRPFFFCDQDHPRDLAN